MIEGLCHGLDNNSGLTRRGIVFMLKNSVKEFDVSSFFEHETKAFTDVLASLESRIDPAAEPQDDHFLKELTDALHRSRVECRAAEKAIGENPELLKEVQEEFRRLIAPWMDQGWFLQRAKAKPRGYPGDFEMLTAIYNGQTKTKGLGGYLDLYFLRTDLARAVCTRLAAVQKFLVREVLTRTTRVSILNVASGPGREYTDGFEEAYESVQLTCIDTDEAALQYLQSRMQENAAEIDLSCVCYNALRMTSPANNRKQFGAPDIIYSVGLCDYLPDRYLIRILDGWRQTVGDDGIVYVAFKDALQYHAAEYQWHVDWHFYERTEEDCRELFAQAGYDVSQMEVERDGTGIIMNFIARAASLRGTRVDQPERLRGPHFRLRDTNGVSAEADAAPVDSDSISTE